jgi:hypothetical protein
MKFMLSKLFIIIVVILKCLAEYKSEIPVHVKIFHRWNTYFDAPCKLFAIHTDGKSLTLSIDNNILNRLEENNLEETTHNINVKRSLGVGESKVNIDHITKFILSKATTSTDDSTDGINPIKKGETVKIDDGANETNDKTGATIGQTTSGNMDDKLMKMEPTGKTDWEITRPNGNCQVQLNATGDKKTELVLYVSKKPSFLLKPEHPEPTYTANSNKLTIYVVKIRFTDANKNIENQVLCDLAILESKFLEIKASPLVNETSKQIAQILNTGVGTGGKPKLALSYSAKSYSGGKYATQTPKKELVTEHENEQTAPTTTNTTPHQEETVTGPINEQPTSLTDIPAPAGTGRRRANAKPASDKGTRALAKSASHRDSQALAKSASNKVSHAQISHQRGKTVTNPYDLLKIPEGQEKSF